MKFKKAFFYFLTILTILLSACGNSQNKNELSKIPEDFPVQNAPICDISEFISYTDKSIAGQYSAEVVYNSNSDYDTVIKFYKDAFPDGICTDFGVAYNILNVMPAGEGHLVSVRIYSTINKGENGSCTVTISALEQ